MELPELPEGLVWRHLDGGMSIRVESQEGEEVAWYRNPEMGGQHWTSYECVSAPVGTHDHRKFHRQPAQTEEEAINLIVTFALLGITKEN